MVLVMLCAPYIYKYMVQKLLRIVSSFYSADFVRDLYNIFLVIFLYAFMCEHIYVAYACEFEVYSTIPVCKKFTNVLEDIFLILFLFSKYKCIV